MAYSNRKTAHEVYDFLGISDKPFEEWLQEQNKQHKDALSTGIGRAPQPQAEGAYKQEGGAVRQELSSKIKSDDKFESLTALMIEQTIDTFKDNWPKIKDNLSEVYENPTADNVQRLAGKSIFTGALLPIKNEIEMSLAKNDDGTWNSKKAEQYFKRTGVRLLSKSELSRLPPDKADQMRSYQGDLLDKAGHGVVNLAHGLAMPFIQSYKNLGVAADSAQKGDIGKAYGQAWGALLDIPGSLVTGLGPMVARATTDYSTFAQEDPVGLGATVLGAKHVGRRAKAGVKGAFEKVEVPREKTWKDFEKVERPEAPVEPTEKATPKSAEQRFQEMADQQRDAPEIKMTEAQTVLGGGILSNLLEHVGDLTHRMGKKFSDKTSFGDVLPKVRSALESLKSQYGYAPEFGTKESYRSAGHGFAYEHAEQMAGNSRHDKISLEDHNVRVGKVTTEYAELHKKIPVYNEMQRAARDAAVALGEGQWHTAIKNLEILKKSLDRGQKHWKKVSLEDTHVGSLTQKGLEGMTIPTIKKILTGLMDGEGKIRSKRKKSDLIQDVLSRQEAKNAPPAPPTEYQASATYERADAANLLRGKKPPPTPTVQGPQLPPQYESGGLRGARAAMREQALKDKDGRLSPSEKITGLAKTASQSENRLVRGAGNTVLQQQQSGALSWVPGIGNKFAGWEPEWVDAYKRSDEKTRAQQIKMFDEMAKIRDKSPEVYSLYKEIMTEGQEQAGLRYNLLKDIADITTEVGPESKALKRLRDKVEAGTAKVETYNAKASVLAEFKDLWDLALKEQDPNKIDRLRGKALKDKILDKDRVEKRKKKLVTDKEYKKAALALASIAPTMAEFYYEGKPMSTLGFLLDSRNRKLDPAKVTVKLLDDAQAYKDTPALLQLAQEHVGNLLNIRKTLDEAGRMLGDVYGKEGVNILGQETLLNNFISGYFPGGKTKKFFDPDKGRAGGAANSLVDIQQHVKMKTEGRKGKKPTRDELSEAIGEEIPEPTLKELRESLSNDQDAYRVFSQYAANVYAMANRAKMISNIKTMGMKNGRIFKSKKEIPKGHEGGFIQLVSEAGDKKARLVEYGDLDGYWVPKTLKRNLQMFQEASMDGLKALASLQNIFKQTHTVMGIPYFVNTTTGLAMLQMLDGGTPLAIMDGMRSLSKKDKFYEAYRDAGFVFDPDRLFGLESGNRSLIMRLTSDIGSRIYKRFEDSPKTAEFFQKAEKLFIQLEDPTKFKKTKTAAKAATVAATTAGLAAYTGLINPATAAGAGVLGLGALQGLALVKGRDGAMMLDQGSRMGSFKRYVYSQAKILSDRQKIPLERAVDMVLSDPQLTRKAAQHAVYINIDYGYLPEGIETQSKYVPTSPFIKFATRATEMMFDMPVQNPIKFASLNQAQRQYFQNLGEEDMQVYQHAPFNTGGMVMPLGRGKFMNLGYMIPMPANIVKEAYALPSTILGMGGTGPRSAAEQVGRQGKEHRSGFPLATGYLAPIAQAVTGVDRYQRKLDDDQVLPTLFSGFITSVPYYAREIEKAFYGGKTKNGLTPGEVFLNALAIKITPLGQLSKQRHYAVKAFNRRSMEIKARHNKTLRDNPGNQKLHQESLLRLRKDFKELQEYMYNAIRQNTISYLNRTEVPNVKGK